MDVVNPDHIKVTFDSIGGLDDIKQALHELVILPLVRPELFSKGKLLKPVKARAFSQKSLQALPTPPFPAAVQRQNFPGALRQL